MALGMVVVVILVLLQSHYLADHPVLNLHLTQWEQNVLLFIVPVLWWVKSYLKRPVYSTLGIRHSETKWLLLAAAAIIAIAYPMDELANWMKESLPWPDVLRQMAEEEQEEQEKLFGLLLSPSGPLGWIENILLMAVITGIGEELVFRGALLSCFRRANINQHLSAWLIGFIFAMVHFDLYGLLPRWFLGTLFCYLFFWSGSLWPSILAHAINNFLALLQYKNGELF